MFYLIIVILSMPGIPQSAKALSGPFSDQASCTVAMNAHMASRGRPHKFVCSRKGDPNWPKVPLIGLPE